MLQDKQISNPLIRSPFSTVDLGLESLDLHFKSSNILPPLKEKVLVFKDFLFERESFDVGERPSLGSNSFLLGNGFTSLVGSLKMKG